MKRLLLCLLLICSSTVYASVPVTVIGVGETLEEAKKDGFRNAIENVAGSVILRNLDVKNYNTIRNELLMYSSGYIDNYKITNTVILNNTNLKYQVHMVVYVSKNKISRRLLTDYKSKDEFDVDQVKSTLDSVINKRDDAHRIIDSVFYDYPDRAFDLSHTYALAFDDRANIVLSIQYNFSWNKYFIDSLKDTFYSLQDGENTGNGSVRVGNSVYYFNDITYINKIKQSLTYSNAYQLQLVLKNREDDIIYSQCFTPITGRGQSMYGIGHNNHINFYPKDTNNGKIEFDLPEHIKTFNSYELNIVAAYKCKR